MEKTGNKTIDRREYQRQFMRHTRFKKWLASQADIDILKLNSADIVALQQAFDNRALNGREGTIDMRRFLMRFRHLVDDDMYMQSEAIERSLAIEQLIADMKRGDVGFMFCAQRGSSENIVKGTLTGKAISAVNGMGYPRGGVMSIGFYDLLTGGWMSMYVGSFIRRVTDCEIVEEVALRAMCAERG